MKVLVCVVLSIVLAFPGVVFAVDAEDLDSGDILFVDEETTVVVVRVINSSKIKVRHNDGSIGFYSASDLKTKKDMEGLGFWGWATIIGGGALIINEMSKDE